MHSIADPIFTVKMPERKIEYVNKAINKVFGYNPDEMIGKTSQKLFVNKAEFLKFGKLLKNALENNKSKVQLEQKLVTKKGLLIWAEVNTTFLFSNGKNDRIISVVRDITERKIAEVAIKSSEERMNYPGASPEVSNKVI